MQNLTLSDLKLGLTDLFDKRRSALLRSSSGKTYEPMLARKLAEISALPPAVVGGRALAAELDETDAEHDSLGKAVWHMTEAYLQHPQISPETAAAAARIRRAFIPALSELKASYADEATAAIERKKVLGEHRADLERFPVAEGETLYHWISGFLGAGERLHSMLSDRADVRETSRKGAGALRAATIGLLSRLRAGLADEVEHTPELPRDLDAQVFGYLDELHGPRAAAARAKKAKKAAPGAAEPAEEAVSTEIT
ncbi:hypothetical protein WMF31_39030 [Sorangium sp. So ce1036]|uniref:hypothetical protein n=1 Tax=Sorangium sp. So ce1036 TaxID=3133328 RepID=UPI003F0CCE90